MKPIALTIAGSDSGGGAGIQADIKAMEANGVFACSVITAITAQNTKAVTDAFDVPEAMIAAQIDAVAGDLPIAAAKTGMLSSSEIVAVVAEKIREHDLQPLVVDPVMISKSGYKLLADDAIDAVRDTLIPLATLVTPNVQEAAHLTGTEIRSVADARDAARALFDMGPAAVVVKGGHLAESEAVDVFFDGEQVRTYRSLRIDTKNTHGTGCTYASAIAAHLARGAALQDAVDRAKRYVTEAIRHALPIGEGHGPTNHFYHLDPERAVGEVES